MSTRVAGLGVWMALAIVLVAGLAYWDARQESENALADFAGEQATLAEGVARAVTAHLRQTPEVPAPGPVELLATVRSIERPASLRLFLARPGEHGLTNSDGRGVRDAKVENALIDRAPTIRLERNESPAFGLPKRTAVAGLSSFDGPGGRWGVVVAATALRERDWQLRAQFRSAMAVVLASGLVLVFGGLAMRKQRKEFDLSRELSQAEREREREEQLSQIDKLATMAALATGIAHEVSTPLGVIVGRAEQLLPKVAGDLRAKMSVESIIEQGSRISDVIRGFLNLVRGEPPPLEHVNPGKVADAARELVDHRFEKAGVLLRTTVERDLPDVACDRRLLEQVVINLLLNACDACEAGGTVELLVRADREHVGFVVTDDGIGITKEAAARAAEPFFTTKPVGKGTGLGLAIASEIVKHHGGTLSIGPRSGGHESESKTERGTRASVELPVAKGSV